MDYIPILTAIISGGTAAIAAIIVAVIQHRKTVAIIEYRLKELEEKVDKHNRVIERTYELEKKTEVQGEWIKENIGRLEKLEQKGA